MAQTEHRLSPGARAGAIAASAGIVAGAVALLVMSSVRRVPADVAPPLSIITKAKPARPRERSEAPNAAPRADSVPAISGAPVQPSEDARAMQWVLSCLERWDGKGERPRDCPPVEKLNRPEMWARRLGDPRREFTADEMYTRAWQHTLIIPKCYAGTGEGGPASVCTGFGITPPPPTKTPEEYCEAAKMGGPCRPPPQDRVVPE